MSDIVRVLLTILLLAVILALAFKIGKRYTVNIPQSTFAPKRSRSTRALDNIIFLMVILFGICTVCFIPLALVFGSDEEKFSSQEAGIVFVILLITFIIGIRQLRRKFFKH